MHLVTERNRKWWVVIAMALTTLLMTIDFNGLTVALPTIGRDLNTSTAGLQWTINAYLLALAAPSVAAGRLADIFGRRRVLLIGTVVFIAGSAASGLAQADWWLIAARVVQGFGAAAFFAASLSIVSNAFPPEERSKGIGVCRYWHRGLVPGGVAGRHSSGVPSSWQNPAAAAHRWPHAQNQTDLAPRAVFCAHPPSTGSTSSTTARAI